MNRNTFLLFACVIAAWPRTASALTYDIYLYRLAEIANKGISATIRETKSGSLDCTLTFDKKRMGSRIASVELSSSTDDSVVRVELRTYETDTSYISRFTLSRGLLLHGQVTIGVEDKIPGGTFYHAAFVDFVDFGGELPPALQRRQSRLAELELQNKLPRYEDTTPMRGEGGDARVLLPSKTRIIPYKPSAK